MRKNMPENLSLDTAGEKNQRLVNTWLIAADQGFKSPRTIKTPLPFLFLMEVLLDKQQT
jgi:hypothetical protein